MMERFMEFTVDGVKGYGISEWNYHNGNGRPEKFSSADPDWFSSVVEEYTRSSKLT